MRALPSQRDRPAGNRLPRRDRHGDLAVRPPGPADPARRRRVRTQAAADRRRARSRASSSSRSSPRGSSSKLGLPQDLLRNLAIALLFVVAATLIVPQLGTLLERPFASLTRRRAGGGGFVLGVSLGLVFVPCAGPVLAAISVVAANNHVGLRAILLTIAYAVGAAIPMLAIALGGRRVGEPASHAGPVAPRWPPES